MLVAEVAGLVAPASELRRTNDALGLIRLTSSHTYYRFNLAWLRTPMPP